MKTYDGYVRVSDTRGREDDLRSPDQQRDRIVKWVALHDDKIRLGEVFVELDVSGGKMARPELDKALARIASGASDGLIVAKLDRFGRTMDASRAIKEIEAAGAELVSVQENWDTSTTAGKFSRTMMLAIAEMELDQRRDGWAVAQRDAVRDGRLPGPTPLGYAQLDDGKLALDEHDAPIVARAFYIAAGQVADFDEELGETGLHAALKYLKDSFPGRSWTTTVATKLLANPIYRGELRHGKHSVKHPHLMIIDPTLWELAQHERAITRRSKLLPTFPLMHIARCGTPGCGAGMVAQIHSTTQTRKYRCISCNAPAICEAGPLEELVLSAVRANPPTLDAAEMVQRYFAVETASQVLEDHLADTDRDSDKTYKRNAWQDELIRLETGLTAARAAASGTQTAPLPDLADPSPGELRTIAERAVESLIVRKGRGPLVERVVLTLRK